MRNEIRVEGRNLSGKEKQMAAEVNVILPGRVPGMLQTYSGRCRGHDWALGQKKINCEDDTI